MILGEHNRKWVGRLKRVLREMPEGLELVVRQGRIAISENGEFYRLMNLHGKSDLYEGADAFPTERVYPDGESL